MTENPFPLNIVTKVNSPRMLAMLAQFGHEVFADADDLNKVFQALQFLYENMGGGTSFDPADYDLDAFQNLTSDPFVRLSQVLTSADLQAVQEGIAWKQPVELNLDSGVTLSGSIPTIASLTQQGVTLVNDSRVIISGLANQIFNGFFRVNATPISGVYRLYRTNDANTTAELNNAVVGVTSGTHAGKTFRQSTLNPTIGSSNIVFAEFGSTVPSATDLIAGITKLYDAVGIQIDGAITPNAVLLALSAKQNALGFASYSSGTTTVGWSSFTQKVLWYIDFNTHYLCFYHLEGPGNGINSSFTVPYTATENSTSQHIVMSNGSYFNNPGRGVISSGSNVVNLYATIPGSTWSAGSSNKIASGFILIKK